MDVRTVRAAPEWDEREASHVREAVFGAKLRSDPSPHVHVENVFSASTYAEMVRLFPSDSPALHRWTNPGEPGTRFGNYERRREIHIPAEAQKLEPERRAFWLGAAEFLHGEAFARTLLDRFEPYARARFGDAIDDPGFVRERLRGTMIVNRHDADYYLGPHTDRSEKVFTCLFYFPEHDGLDHLGTTIYRPLDPTFTCDGLAHHDPARFERRETVPYRSNSALLFARTDVMFHGVHALTADELNGSMRRSIQMQFWIHNERPRDACRTTLWVAAPDELRIGSDALMPFQLTNRAATELASGFPFPTQLGYRWVDAGGRVVDEDAGVRTSLPPGLLPGATATGEVRVVAPGTPGSYELRVAVVQEGVAWFDDIEPSNGALARVRIVDDAALASAATDIVPATHDIALGDGWYPLEQERETRFRWVGDEAVVHVASLRPVRHTLRVVVEPGPGVGPGPLALTARLSGGEIIGRASVTSRETVMFELPPESPRAFSVGLSATGGGCVVQGDPRVLNFRVFSIAVTRTADVLPAWAVPTSGFYPVESHEGERFRWVGGAGTVALHSVRDGALRFDAESGPGLGSQRFRLRVLRPDGSELTSAEVGSRTRVIVPLTGETDLVSLVLRADGGGAGVAGDPRTLDFRIFAVTE